MSSSWIRYVQPYVKDAYVIIRFSINYEANMIIAMCSDIKIRIWELFSGKLIREINYVVPNRQLNDMEIITNEATCIAVDESYYYTGCYSGLFRIWDVQSGNQLHLLELHNNKVSDVAVVEDKLVLGSRDHCISIVNRHTGALNHRIICVWAIKSIAVTKTRVVAGCETGDVSICDINTGQSLHSVSQPYYNLQNVCVFGSQVVAGLDSISVRVWDINTGNYVTDYSFPNSTFKWVLKVGSRIYLGLMERGLGVIDTESRCAVKKLETDSSGLFCSSGSVLGYVRGNEIKIEDLNSEVKSKVRVLAKVVCLDLLRELTTFLFAII